MSKPDVRCHCGTVIAKWSDETGQYEPPFNPFAKCPGCGRTQWAMVQETVAIINSKRKVH